MKINEQISLTKRVLKVMFRLDRTYTLCLIFGAFTNALTPYISIFFSAKLIDALFTAEPLSSLILYISLTVGLTFLFTVLNQWISSVQTKAEDAVYRAEAWMYSEKAMSMAYESVEDHDVQLLLERIKKETQTGFNWYFLHQTIRGFIFNTTQFTASAGMTFTLFLIPTITLPMKAALIAGILLTIGLGICSTAKTAALDAEFFDSCIDMNILNAKYNDYITDYSAGKDIRLYGMADILAENAAETDRQFYSKALEKNRKQAVLALPETAMNDFLKYGTYLILISASLQGAVSIGSIAKYVSCLMLLISAVSKLVQTAQQSSANAPYLKRYFSYFDIPNNMYQGTLTVEKRDDNEYYVEFCDVSFRYPNTESFSLRHVNIKFRIGEKLAIVGMNGSGKTTFIKLLCRLYDPTEGVILLNGVDIRKYNYNEYISVFSIVFQDFRLLALTLGQNVAASESFDPVKVQKCLVQAGLEEWFASLPEGTETCLYHNFSKKGIEISGGEAQKIALARALYKDAPFIVLDEPTAALDPVSEYEIYSRFNEIVGEKTAIYISHRLASCRFCDTIAVFDNGRIVQRGTHEELLRVTGGKYCELWHAQAQYYKE